MGRADIDPAPGRVAIKNKATGQCATIYPNSLLAPISLGTCGGYLNQKFRVYADTSYFGHFRIQSELNTNLCAAYPQLTLNGSIVPILCTDSSDGYVDRVLFTLESSGDDVYMIKRQINRCWQSSTADPAATRAIIDDRVCDNRLDTQLWFIVATEVTT